MNNQTENSNKDYQAQVETHLRESHIDIKPSDTDLAGFLERGYTPQEAAYILQQYARS